MATAFSANTPKHLWVVGILSLLWNGFGAYDYTMSHIGGLAYFESMGFDAAAYDWFHALPDWAIGAWAVGVWISLLGSVLLLLRSRHATTAFAVSLLGALASFAYQFTSTDKPASMESGMAAVMPIVIVVLIVAQWWYARSQKAAGVLR